MVRNNTRYSIYVAAAVTDTARKYRRRVTIHQTLRTYDLPSLTTRSH